MPAIRHAGFATAALLAAALGPIAAAQAQNSPKQLVPQGTHIAIIAPGLERIQAGFEDLQNAIPMLPLDNAIDGVESMAMEFGPAYDGGRAAVVVIPNVMMLAATAQAGQPAVVILVPVNNYASFVENLGGSGSDAVTQIFPPDSPPMFAKRQGDYAAVSANQISLQQYKPGGDNAPVVTQLSDDLEAKANGDAVAIYVNLEALGPVALPFIDMGITQAVGQMEMQLSGTDMDDDMIDLQIAQFRMIAETFKTLLRDCTAALIAIDLDDTAAALDISFQMKAGSTMAGYFPGGADVTGGIAKLPADDPFIAASTLDAQAIRFGDLMQSMADFDPAIRQSLVGYDSWGPLLDDMGQYSYAVYAPTAEQTALRAVARVEYGDPAAARAAMPDIAAAMNNHEVPVGPTGETMTYAMSMQPDAGETEGLSYDSYTYSVSMPEALTRQMGPAAGFISYFNTYNGLVTATDSAMIATTVPDPALLAAAIRAESSQAADPDMILAARESAQPAGLALEMYLNLEGVVTALNNLGPATGMPPIASPGDLEPIAIGVGIESNALTYRTHLPFASLNFLAEEGQKLMGGMMGGGMPQPAPNRGPRAPF
jgi:hypothetical protein